MEFRDPGKNMTWPQYVTYREARMRHERGEDQDTTEEKMEHDAPHPSSIEEEE